MSGSVTNPDPATGAPTKRPTLQSVQVMRGIAAIAVAIYHTHLYLSRPQSGGIEVFGSFAAFGWSGVNFFFVLSGFIIMLAHAQDIGRPDRVGRYLWRRFSRVYPVYWIFLTAYIAAAAAGFGEPDFSWDPLNLISSYLLVQLGFVPSAPLKVAWTLFYEVAFYTAFLVLILSRFWGLLLAASWTSAILINAFVFGNTDNGWYIHSWNLYFLIGAGTFMAFQRLEPSWGLWILIAGLALLTTAMASGSVDPRIGTFQDRPLRLVALAFPFAMILLGSALAERHYGWRPSVIALVLGEASYAIYLVHSAVISIAAPIVQKVGGNGLPDAVRFLSVAGAAVAAGVAAHLLLERPLLRGLRRLGERRSAPGAQPAQSG